jgi:peroxiredoxin
MVAATVALALLAGASGGSDQFDDDASALVGHPMPGWTVSRWYNSPPLAPRDLRGKVVLLRWFASPNCPLCTVTAPALRQLWDEFKDQGLMVIGMYHHKDPEPMDPEGVRRIIEHYRFQFPVAIDPDWQTLKRWWLDGHPRRFATSISVLVDRAGVVQYVHRGGRLGPESADFAEVRRRIKQLLARSVCVPRSIAPSLRGRSRLISQRLQEGQQGLAIGGGQRAGAQARWPGLAAVPEDGLQQRAGAAVVQEAGLTADRLGEADRP